MRYSLFQPIVLLALASSAFAQSASILYPTANQTVQAGQNLTVVIGESDSLTGLTEVGIAIGIELCEGQCRPVNAENPYLGTLIEVAPFHPQFDSGFYTMYENYTITVPMGYTGEALLDIAHFYVLGASAMPSMDLASVAINIE